MDAAPIARGCQIGTLPADVFRQEVHGAISGGFGRGVPQYRRMPDPEY